MEDTVETLLQKIIAKVYEINKTGKYTMFFDYSGHVDWAEIHYCIGEYQENKNCIYMQDRRINKENLESILEELKKLEEK